MAAHAAPTMPEPLLVIQNLSKTFGGVHALSGIDLEIAQGEVHALVGENGAGKSTLIKILTGVVEPDKGSVLVEGRTLPFADVHASRRLGIAAIHQELSVFPDLSAEDNIFVGREPRRLLGLLLDRRRIREETRCLLDRLGETFHPSVPVSALSMAQRQMVAIARALSQQCRLLIMDEPTASLSAREARVLHQVVRQLRDSGVSVLYVSHRLEEIFTLADRVTVFRDGKHIATHPVAEVSRERLIALMVGRELEEVAHEEKAPESLGEPLLEVRGLARHGVFHDVSFHVRSGEVVALAGLVGAGRSEVAQAIFGIDRYDAGEIRLAGRILPPGSVPESIRRGLALVPEDRQRLGLVLPLTVETNLVLVILRQLTRLGFRSPRRERSAALDLIRHLSIRTATPVVPAETLSGGNQQKLMVGKWLAAAPRVLLLDEPTRGVDVGAKAEIYRLIRALARDGMATLVISSDLPEVLTLADRILVMREGRISGELGRAEATQERILDLALPVGAEILAAGAESPGDTTP